MVITLLCSDSTCRRQRRKWVAQCRQRDRSDKKEEARRHFEEQGIICPANKTLLNWIWNRVGEGERRKEKKIDGERERWRWPLLLNTLIAALMPVMLQCQPRQRGIGWRWWNRLRDFPCARQPGSGSTESPLHLYTVIVIITKAQQKERQLSSWRAWHRVNRGWGIGRGIWKATGVACWIERQW